MNVNKTLLQNVVARLLVEANAGRKEPLTHEQLAQELKETMDLLAGKGK